jgi:hypothetical protein
VIRSVAVALTTTAALGAGLAAQKLQPPRIWDDAALAEWATPVAGLNVRPAHFSSAEYYAAPVDNLRTYPVYHPDSEPAGYWEWLQKQKPEPLVDLRTIRSDSDWVAAGERAFREMDAVLLRTNDPAVIAQARDPRSFEGLFKFPDGSAFGPRWVVTSEGVMLSVPACANCHRSRRSATTIEFAGPGGAPASPGGLPLGVRGLPFTGPIGTLRRVQASYVGDLDLTALWREFTTPWAPDERIERMRGMTIPEFQKLVGPGGLGRSFAEGVTARPNGSPYYVTKIMDLQNLRYSRYLDATATHRLRGPEDVARYTALVTGADPMEFGPHRIRTAEQRALRFRYADEVLYAIGTYLMSLEPPRNPNPAPRDLLDRGEQLFRREGCVNCHVPPNYTSGRLTLADGWEPPPDHPNRDDIVARSVGTDPGAALKTRKGTGFYKIPSLRGVWYRPLLLHDGSLRSLEEMFDPARLSPDYDPKGWGPPGVTRRAVPGHVFGLSLTPDEKSALLAFLRSL